MRPLVAFALLVALAPSVAAQKTVIAAPAHLSPARPAPPGFTGLSQLSIRPDGEPFRAFRRSWPRNSEFLPFFPDFAYLDDLYASGYPVASQPPYIFVQGGNPPAPEPGDRTPSVQQPLLIELQGDRYVEVSNPTFSAGQPALPVNATTTASRATRSTTAAAVPTAPSTNELTPVLLLFRDGHSEEVRDYTIANGILYARGDFYTDGFWTKCIELAALNLPATLKANHDRSVKFLLPSSPNEVITRP